MISRAQADSFLVDILKFKNWQEVLETDKLKFLQLLVPHYAHHLAFQNISMSSIPVLARRVPTAQDIIAAGLSGEGGACITQNSFLVILLKALDFNSYVISGFVHGPGNTPDNHVICAVELSSMEKYVLELGVGLPVAGPIPMHQLPFYGRASGHRYLYKEDVDKPGVYLRIQLDGSLNGDPFVPKDTEFLRYDFSMVPQSIEFFEKHLHEIFTNPDVSIFLQRPFMFRYFEENEATGELLEDANITGNRKWMLIRGCSVLTGTDETATVKHYDTYDEVKPVILKYFPRFPKEQVEKSFACFNESVAKHGYFKATR